ncbi:MAG: DeoR/GlpR family DNA-binding transcription regulator [Propionibacteriaceae bacterium]|jgi:DeoR/GlpR family transcriptional regulator of sugar metabolism|nr:DeoR/GlpR family DNA-binding transcription regulator [Propionibacteriaceae bacterium]
MVSQQETAAGSALPVTRRSVIRRKLADLGVVRTQDLVDELGVSVETVRRDMAALERDGALERVHGGAVAAGQRLSVEPSFHDRTSAQGTGKARIGQAAARLVSDESTLFLDVGTTALCVAAAIPASFRGLVATNSLPVAIELARCPHATVLVAGGRLRSDDLATAGQYAIGLLEDLRVDLAFLGSGGVHPTSGLTDFHLDEIATRRAMMRNSARTFVLADATKFARIAPYHVAGWDSFTALITDEEPPAVLRTAVQRGGATVIVAQ